MKRIPYDIEWKVESFHWWFYRKKEIAQRLLHSLDVPQEFPAVDIGCGTVPTENIKISGISR